MLSFDAVFGRAVDLDLGRITFGASSYMVVDLVFSFTSTAGFEFPSLSAFKSANAEGAELCLGHLVHEQSIQLHIQGLNSKHQVTKSLPDCAASFGVTVILQL